MIDVNLSDIQGNILIGYNMHFVRHLIVRIAVPAVARQFFAAVVSGAEGVPQLTTAMRWEDGQKPNSCLNVGVTARGLRALGLNEHSLATFPEEFLAGAAARATKVGDVDDSAPEHWRGGLGPGDYDDVHVMWTIHAGDEPERERVTEALQSHWKQSGAFELISTLDGAALPDTPAEMVEHGGEILHRGNKVHFGYRDSIAQPHFDVNGLEFGLKDAQPPTPLGAVLLGYPETSFRNVKWRETDPPELAKNGCFNAFRVLEQDVEAFEQFLDDSAEQLRWNKELVAAKLMGRWRNGVPLAETDEDKYRLPGQGMPTSTDESGLNDFDYPDSAQGIDDLEGRPCPLGAHIRRANPRGSRIVQRSANYTRPIVRRGVPYGPIYDPAKPPDGEPRGLLGVFMCASLIAQFEALMYDWINLGLHDPRLTGTNDPIIGANKKETSRFEIRVAEGDTRVLKGFGRFTETVGALYLFCPSVTAIRLFARAEK